MNDGAGRQPWQQAGFGVRLDWGPVGAARIGGPDAVLVLVDVLSFTTCVSVAVGLGTAVYPAPWHDGRARLLADEVGAALAVGREETTAESPWSLSPADLAAAAPVSRLVLPSPNGSSIAAAARGTVVAACVRNASAVAEWLLGEGLTTPGRPVAVVAAGERWPDGSLRPALEDLLGAAAVVTALSDRAPATLSPEAAAARAALAGTSDVAAALRDCASGRELVGRGWAADVELAAARDVDAAVPVLRAGAFVDVAGA